MENADMFAVYERLADRYLMDLAYREMNSAVKDSWNDLPRYLKTGTVATIIDQKQMLNLRGVSF